jgi:hypothetical protein
LQGLVKLLGKQLGVLLAEVVVVAVESVQSALAVMALVTALGVGRRSCQPSPRIVRVKELGKLEASYIERNKKASGSGSKNPSIILQSQYRRVLGRHPEIHPLLHPDPAAAGVPFGNGRLMGSPLHSRWLLTRRDPEGSWKEILDMDSWNLGYINRLFFESDDRAKLADVMDSFCRDRLRLADVLDILGSTCVFQRLVPNRSNPREVVTSRQLDAAYHLEHPEPLEENRALGGEEDVNRDINQGRPLPAESTEPDDDLKNDREKVGKRKE